MKWKINYYSKELEEEILNLPDTLLARYLRLSGLMQTYGPHIGMPHTKAIGDGLFELRLKGKEGIARVFYCTMQENNIHMLYSFIKKTNKIPPKDLQTARKRMQEIKKNA